MNPPNRAVSELVTNDRTGNLRLLSLCYVEPITFFGLIRRNPPHFAVCIENERAFGFQDLMLRGTGLTPWEAVTNATRDHFHAMSGGEPPAKPTP